MSAFRVKRAAIISLMVLPALLVSSPIDAQQSTPPAPGPARPLNLPKITEHKLANGLTVILAPLPRTYQR